MSYLCFVPCVMMFVSLYAKIEAELMFVDLSNVANVNVEAGGK